MKESIEDKIYRNALDQSTGSVASAVWSPTYSARHRELSMSLSAKIHVFRAMTCHANKHIDLHLIQQAIVPKTC